MDQIWIVTATRIGLRVRRSDAVYAATGPDKTLHVGHGEHLDADDSLAQMIFHELCHSLVEGHEAFERPDWGLDNTSERDLPREQACLRVQAALSAPYGLRRFLAPTTEHRAFYDQLGEDPLTPSFDPSVLAAVTGVGRADRYPWAPHLREALTATAEIARRAAAFTTDVTSLWSVVEPALATHSTGLQCHPATAKQRCADCAWLFQGGPGPLIDQPALNAPLRSANSGASPPTAPKVRPGVVDRCRQAGGKPVDHDERACERWEPALDCLRCGACCRAAYHSVTIMPTEPLIDAHPDMVVDRGEYVELRRSGDRCAALEGGDAIDGDLTTPFTCRIYEDRPRNCREFERSGEHCLTARRRVGLSR